MPPRYRILFTVDLAYPGLPDEERDAVKQALKAAAIPHWCDAGFLSALLGTGLEEAARLIRLLAALRIVEPFPARGEEAVNVHEASRLALREHLRVNELDLWESLARKPHAFLSGTSEPHMRIEALFHHFAFDQTEAVCECVQLDFELHAGHGYYREPRVCGSLAEPSGNSAIMKRSPGYHRFPSLL